ncbi:hypothetical protein [Limimaricola litoreus]|uniref:Uncharacterized protein n=1 Tax=Limimaricola litoreus TaxID=2955316 RepID=A0A9X2JN21_9RHOB|nr:hypothetical protein [Limimaricola litoreus]MCP1167773.1 hypothetical protein [Limimaricola litoreus]
MAKLPDPRIEICAKARLIETHAHALAVFARHLAEIRDPILLEPEQWTGHSQSSDAPLNELSGDVDTVISKAQHAV